MTRYSGIFIKSKTPDNYKVNDRIMVTFLTPKGHPQKRNGQVARKDKNGIGVHFIR